MKSLKEVSTTLDRISVKWLTSALIDREDLIKLFSISRNLLDQLTEARHEIRDLERRLSDALSAYHIAKLQYDQAVNHAVEAKCKTKDAELQLEYAKLEFHQSMATMNDMLENEREAVRQQGLVPYKVYKHARDSRRGWMEALLAVLPSTDEDGHAWSLATAPGGLRRLLVRRYEEGQAAATHTLQQPDVAFTRRLEEKG